MSRILFIAFFVCAGCTYNVKQAQNGSGHQSVVIGNSGNSQPEQEEGPPAYYPSTYPRGTYYPPAHSQQPPPQQNWQGFDYSGPWISPEGEWHNINNQGQQNFQ